MKAYLDLLEGNSKSGLTTKDYTGVEFIVKNDEEVEILVDRFRATTISGRLEGFKQRKRAVAVSDNQDASSAFGLTKFILRVPVLVDPIPDHPLNDLTCQLLPVEVQILTLDDHQIRRTHPDAKHESYKKRQFKRLFPAIFPMTIYRPFL
ncbi:hypothetical protein HY988_00060 [Candidatus Micrarchaeota archaeon]|nr:hypothetical protein [Candidatus Micrarchaeota archaeon]